MYNQTEVQALKAQVNHLRNIMHQIINLEICAMDQGRLMAVEAINQTKEQCLAEYKEMVIDQFK